MSGTNDPNQGSSSPWSSTRTQLATGFVVVLIVAGILIAIFHHGGGSHHSPQPTQPVASNPVSSSTTTGTAKTSTTKSSPPAVGGCSLPAGNQTVPNAAPPDGLQWAAVGAMNAPQSPTIGPQHHRDGVGVCFAHNPTGALIAAFNIWASSTADIDTKIVWRETSIDVPSNVANEQGVLDKHGSFEIAGYKYGSYTSSAANVTVVLQSPKGGLLAIDMPMRWSNGDWKYVYNDSGGPVMQQLPGTTLTGAYVSWSNF